MVLSKRPATLGSWPALAAMLPAIDGITKPGAKVNRQVIHRQVESDSMPAWLPWAGIGIAGVAAIVLLRK